MGIIFDRGGVPCDPEEFFGTLEVCEAMGMWRGVDDLLKMTKGVELANSLDPTIRSRIEVWKVKLKAAQAYEAKEGFGALLNWEHRLTVSCRKNLLREAREAKERGVFIFPALEPELQALS